MRHVTPSKMNQCPQKRDELKRKLHLLANNFLQKYVTFQGGYEKKSRHAEILFMEEILYIYIYTCITLLEIYERTVGRFSSEVKIAQLLNYGNPSWQTLEDDDPSNSAIRTKPTPLKHIKFDAQKYSRYNCSCIVIAVSSPAGNHRSLVVKYQAISPNTFEKK